MKYNDERSHTLEDYTKNEMNTPKRIIRSKEK